jgi:hypothetical protein
LTKSKIFDTSQIISTDRYSKSGCSNQTSRPALKFEDLGNISPFLQKKLNALAGKTKTQSSGNCKINPNCVGVLIALHKIVSQRLLYGLRALEKLSSPIAFTQCPKCDHVGLSLLTTSTKQNFSPKFTQKIISILPNRLTSLKNAVRSNPTKKLTENYTNYINYPKENLENSFKKYDHNYYTSKSSGILRENNVEKVLDLDITNVKRIKTKINCKKGVDALKECIKGTFKAVFQKIELFYDDSVIEYEPNPTSQPSVLKSNTLDHKSSSVNCNTSIIQRKNWNIIENVSKFQCSSQIQTIAFKILHTRLNKIIFRRKLHIFIHLFYI